MTSYFAAITLTDFLAKARLFDREFNLMCKFNCIMAAFINKSSAKLIQDVYDVDARKLSFTKFACIKFQTLQIMRVSYNNSYK